MINRATKSLTLYYQMIGRGSRLLRDKNTFEVIDLGNNFYRFGEWGSDIDWHKIFRNPMNYLDSIQSDEEIELMSKEIEDEGGGEDDDMMMSHTPEGEKQISEIKVVKK